MVDNLVSKRFVALEHRESNVEQDMIVIHCGCLMNQNFQWSMYSLMFELFLLVMKDYLEDVMVLNREQQYDRNNLEPILALNHHSYCPRVVMEQLMCQYKWMVDVLL